MVWPCIINSVDVLEIPKLIVVRCVKVGAAVRLSSYVYETDGSVLGPAAPIPSSALVLRPCPRLPGGMMEPSDQPSGTDSNGLRLSVFRELMHRVVRWTT